MKKLLLTDWNVMRIIRLVLGVLATGAGIVQHDVLVGSIGGLLIFQAAMNMSCAGGACSVPPRTNKTTTEEIQYEEIKH